MPTIYLPERKKRVRKERSKSDNNNFKWVYNTSTWRELRLQYLSENPLCNRCMEDKNETIKSAIEVHHKIPLSSESTMERKRAIGFDWNNLEGLCFEHHHEIHDKKRMLK